ncbi:hypothetical protein PVK06_008418 [Gossypium arboreum]|uniref:Uncharacterized protein n=1 Tax=Gossypium arboreum TaxID=29729 RepID=A0ABR0QJW3_GOSAR|nr:hypothetical protein PVK06_008418 [Gossypium arboreum]
MRMRISPLTRAQLQQAQYWAYVRSRDLAPRRSLQKKFIKQTNFPIFPTTLLPLSDVTEEPTQTATKEPTQPTVGDPKRTTSLNIEKDEEEGKYDTTTTTTTKGKDHVPPSPPASITTTTRGNNGIKSVPENPLIRQTEVSTC